MRAAVFFVLSLSAALVAGFGATAQDWSLGQLMAQLAQVHSATAHFTEKRQIASLTRPIESSGTLLYEAPDHLEKHTQRPAAEDMVLSGDTLTGTQSNGRSFTVSLADHAELAVMVEGIRSTMAGDLATLRRYYEVEFGGSRSDWKIGLTPKDPAVREKIAHILLGGSDAVIRTISVLETDGDRSEMIVTPDKP